VHRGEPKLARPRTRPDHLEADFDDMEGDATAWEMTVSESTGALRICDDAEGATTVREMVPASESSSALRISDDSSLEAIGGGAWVFVAAPRRLVVRVGVGSRCAGVG
jgi:hypothetical protein